MPKISIIIPVYNLEKYLAKCIESVLAQTFTEFELILVDDGSTDGSADICDSFMANDKRVTVIHKPNGGVSTARNAGIEYAHGEYIGFVDGDDYIEPTMYSTLINAIEEYQADIAICGFKVIDEDKGIIEKIQNSGTVKVMDQYDLMCSETDMPWSIRLDTINKLFSRSLIGELRYDEKLRCAEDTLFLHQAISKADRGVFVEKPLYVNVRHSGSAMRGRLNSEYYYKSYLVDKSIYEDIKRNYPDLAERAFLVFINNCIWKLEDVCRSLRGRANKEDVINIKKMKKYMHVHSFRILTCKSLTIKQKLGLFLIAISIRDRKLQHV